VRVLKNPWWIVVGSFAALTVSLGAVGATLGLFIQPLQSEFGWDRATVSGALGLSSLVAAFGLTFVGWTMDRLGVRRVVIWAIFAFGLAVGLLSQTHSLAALFALSVLIGLAGAAHTPVGFVKSISAYIDGRRGLATGIAVAGVGVGTAAIPLLAHWLIAHFGWRAGLAGLGGLVWAVGLPATYFLVRDPGSARNEDVASRAPELEGLSAGDALRTRSFWMIATAVPLISAPLNGSLIHLASMLSAHGSRSELATAALATAGLSTVIGRFAIGWLFDRWFAPRVAAPVLVIAAAGLIAIKMDAFPLLGVATIGIGMGAELDMIGYLTSRYFGLRKQGMLSGFFYALAAFGLGAGQYLYGLMFTTFRSYDLALTSAAVLLLLAATLVSTLGPYVFAPAVERFPKILATAP
jgi:MFS family permease